MKKIWLIFKREYITKVKKKAFVATTLLVPILMVGASIGIGFLSSSSTQKLKLAVKDESGLFENKIRGLDTEELNFKYFDSLDISKDSLTNSYTTLGYDGVLYIPDIDFDAERQLKHFNYYSNQTLGLKTKAYLEQELSKVIRSAKLKRLNYDEDLIAELDKEIQILTSVKGEEEITDGKTETATAIGYLIAFIIYIYLFAYGSMVMRSVMEEKNNRIVEVIVTTIKPFQLMMGKILGIGAVGLTQLLIWVVIFITTSMFATAIIGPEAFENANSMQAASTMDQADMEMKIASVIAYLGEINWFRVGFSFLFYFFFGYILYAAQFAAVGSAASDDGDVQTLMFPISLPIIISIVIMMTVIEDPYSGMANWASMIPLTSPVVMMARIPFFDNAFWPHQLLSMLVLAGSAIGMVWIAGRIYRIGILVQGQKVTFKKLWKWLRY